MPTAEAVRAWDRTTDVQTWSQTGSHAPNTLDSEDWRAGIKKAKRILELADDWDGEGAKGYSSDTFERALAFLTAHSDFLSQFDLALPPPGIGAGPEGSIDLHWKRPSWELLVNIPADTKKMASFYGDNYGVQKIKGSLDPNTYNVGLAAWLMN